MSFLTLRTLAALAVVAVSSMTAACGGAIGSAQQPGDVGTKAPNFSAQSLNGKGAVSLGSLAGKVTVVEFWATWCEPCKKSLVDLEELRKRSGGSIEVVGISVDDTPRGVEAFAKAQGLSFPIVWDENHSMMFRWSVTEMPATFVLDGKGNIRFVHEPEKNKDPAELIAREVAQLTDQSTPPSEAKTEVAAVAPSTAASPHVALAVAVTDPTPPAAAPVATPPTSETPATPATEDPKPRAKPSAGKKGAAKATTKKKKKNAAASDNAAGG